MTEPRDPVPDVRNSPVEEPVRTTPLPGEPPEPHSDPIDNNDDPSPGYIDTGPTEGGVGSE